MHISVTLSASQSTDSDGKLVAYKWNKISGPSSYAFSTQTAVSTTVSKLTEGTYVFEVTVTDDKGASASDRVTIEVKGLTVPTTGKGGLVANAGADQVITLPVNNIVLSGAGTVSPNGKITAYEWTKISGPAKYNFRAGKSSVNPVINLVEGVYVFRLKVTDVTGATSTDDVTITVKPVKTVATSNNSARVETVVAEELKLYPVPVNDILNFSYQSNNQQEKLLVSIVDANGRVVMKFSFEKNDYKFFEELNLSQLKQGVYFFQLDSKKVHNLVQ
ncbi:MAG: T9SS type A sorting domain-containing protein, partial [Cytophagaceae bacterium]